MQKPGIACPTSSSPLARRVRGLCPTKVRLQSATACLQCELMWHADMEATLPYRQAHRHPHRPRSRPLRTLLHHSIASRNGCSPPRRRGMQSPPASLTLQSISLQVGVPASTCHTYRHWAVPEAGRCGKGVSLLRPGSDHVSHRPAGFCSAIPGDQDSEGCWEAYHYLGKQRVSRCQWS